VALNKGSMAGLIIFDLFAAFGVIDHPIPLNRLDFSFDIKEKALSWIKSYFIDKIHYISVANNTSPNTRLHVCVQQ